MNRLPLFITVAGTVPFVMVSLCVSMRMVAEIHFFLEVLLVYAAVIITFLGGVHWGLAVTQYGRDRDIANLLIITGIVPSLVGWSSLLSRDIHTELLGLTLIYSLLWAADSLLYNSNIIPQWFFNVRCIVTPVIVVSLYVAYFGLV